MNRAVSNEQRYPTEEIRELDIWLVWAYDGKGRKRPRAPWLNEHCYPVSWGSDAEERPETTFEEAERWSRFSGAVLGNSHPFPDDAADEDLKLGMLLPYEDLDPPLMQADLDDVRDPETGEITADAQWLIAELDAYTMISTSGTGIHIYVRAALPDRMGKFIEDLPEVGQVELYDHGRFAAITGDWVAGTPANIPERQAEIDQIIERYESETTETAPEPTAIDAGSGSNGGGSAQSPYYGEPILNFAEPGHPEETAEGWMGAHPGHGGTSKSDEASTNYNVNTDKNVWNCFAHSSGGGPLAAVAVLSGEITCTQCGNRNVSALSNLSDEAFARVCLTARDEYGFAGDPPYRALVGVARAFHLSMADREEGILGRDCHEIASGMYERLSAREV